jgi:secreted trypsin-like serine protease
MQMLKFCGLLGLAVLFIACEPQSSSSFLQTPVNKNSDNIIGGTTAGENEFPFLINIWIDSPKDNYVAHLCGATLIDKKWVLTAAHCMMEDYNESEMRVVPTGKLIPYIGSLHHSGAGGRKLKVKSIQVHPEYNWPNHDVALVELAETVTDVAPISLNEEDLGNSTDVATVIGWGLTDAAGTTEASLLQKVNLSLEPRNLCSQDGLPRSNNATIGADMLCAQTNHHQTSSCPGDSGGPLVQFKNGRFVQIGIVSWSSACAGRRPNYNSSVAGYADVSDALAWIRKTIK